MKDLYELQINDKMNEMILAFHKFAMYTYYFCLGWGRVQVGVYHVVIGVSLFLFSFSPGNP